MLEKLSIVVTEPEYVKARDIFDSAPDMDLQVTGRDEKDVVVGIQATRAWGAILGVETYDCGLYEALPRGGIIARFGVGHDGINKARATEQGIYVTNTPGVLEDAVAEHAIALILGLSKSLGAFALSMRDGQWAPFLTREIRGKQLTIVGCGAIGRRVGRIAATGFGMRVVGVEVAEGQERELCEDWGFAAVTADLGDGVRTADFISIHIPSIPATHHLFGRDVFAMMPERASLINTSRGAVIDENALYDALVGEQLAGAALDVFEAEPYAPAAAGRDIRQLPNVLSTPHVSSGTVESCARVAHAAFRNVRAARDGKYGELDLINTGILASVS